MSRIGKKPVKVPPAVKVELKDSLIKISGGSESLTLDIRPEVNVEYDSEAGLISVTRKTNERFHRALHGTVRALIENMIEGVTKGFQKTLKIYGTGYGVKEQGKDLLVTIGFAKPAVLPVPPGITLDIKAPNTRGNDVPAEFTVKGPDKCVVGQFAAAIRNIRKAEPYLGKGIRYSDEVVKKKVGKAFGSAG